MKEGEEKKREKKRRRMEEGRGEESRGEQRSEGRQGARVTEWVKREPPNPLLHRTLSWFVGSGARKRLGGAPGP